MAALTGLQIQKLLPKTNCKECGSNTCMAFAMKLAAKKAELSQCPYASDEAKQVLGAASEPPVRVVAVGPARTIKLGGETVLYRHEKTFVNQTALAVNIDDTLSDADIDVQLERIAKYTLERVGETLVVDMVCVTHAGVDAKRFAEVVRRAHDRTGRPVVVHCTAPEVLAQVAQAMDGGGLVLSSASPGSAAQLGEICARHGHSLALTAPDLDSLHQASIDLAQSGFRDIFLQFKTHGASEQFQTASIARRAALKDSVKPLGYPHLRFLDSVDLLELTAQATGEICKYGGICVLPVFDPALLATLMTLRQNIYTDPQKPIQVEPKVYAVGEPTPDSPVFLTTNFSLTYFIVSGEIENSGTSAWLLVPECEGMSVLTAWAAGKFSADKIAKFVKQMELETKVRTREIIIPGYVSQMSGELEEQLPGWKAVVGPQEAADIESFVKARAR